ncbi:tigger transposable element-derived protein 4 [Aplysia californica]|uniref:Tigger transposable element-derived protein 4 n=1 Tax=Aplysia californica TaxID=6500 RepID=A0ABM0JQ10_APLCA|nr:tigger transposable element-derived protein 4 [Aplysia californica]
MAAKRTTLTIEQKLNIIEEMESGQDQDQNFAETARKHGVSRSVISRLWKTREETRSTAKDFQNLSRKRKARFKEEDVDIALNVWLCQKNEHCARINGPILKQKAQQLAEEMGHDFTPSEGWLSRFKERHSITFRRGHAREIEKQRTDFELAQNWKDRVMVGGFLNDYSPNDIYNAGETGIFFKGLPDRGFVYRNAKISGGKKQKDRLTILICANMSGTDKKKLLVIGKSKSPRGFPSKVSKLPVDYKHSDNALMTPDIFTDFLRSWDQSLRLQRRSIVLFVDTCRAHLKPTGLTCIKLEFLPPNTTATHQPMDQGIIRNFKCHYRAAVNNIIISELDSDESKKASDILATITVLRAIYLLQEAWSLVTPETIKNCYKCAGFVINSTSEDVPAIINPVTFIPPKNMDPEMFEEFIAVDDDAPVTGELTDGEIVQLNTLVERKKRSRAEVEVEEESAEAEEVEVEEAATKMPSPSELLQSLNTVRVFMESAGLTSQTKFQAVTRAVQESVISNRKQSFLTDFFPTK